MNGRQLSASEFEPSNGGFVGDQRLDVVPKLGAVTNWGLN
jgi:hypothetical protein